MSLTLAAVGAVTAALIELTVLYHLRVGSAHLHLVFVLAIVWTLVVGIEGGLVWAFVGGLVMDFLAPRPLGSTAFTLLVVVGAAAVAGRAFGRLRYAAPILLTFGLSFVYSLLFIAVFTALRPSPGAPGFPGDPIDTVLPGAIFDTVVAAILGPLAISIRARSEEGERIGW